MSADSRFEVFRREVAAWVDRPGFPVVSGVEVVERGGLPVAPLGYVWARDPMRLRYYLRPA